MKDLYRLFNRTTTNVPEAEPLTDEEVNAIMKRFRTEETTGKAEERKGKKKTITIVTAIIMAACCGTAAVGAEHLGIFSRLNQKKDMTFNLHVKEENGEEYDMELPVRKVEMPYDYDKIAEAADEVADTVIAESDGLTIQVDSVYCDGQTLMISLSGSMKDGNPDHKNMIALYQELSVIRDGKWYSHRRSNTPFIDGWLYLDEGTDNQFSGSIEILFREEDTISEPETIEINIGYPYALENYLDEDYVPLDRLNFSVDVVPDPSLKSNGDPYTITKDGYSIRFYEISPAMMTVGFYSPDVEGAWIWDENGEPLSHIPLSELPDSDDGYAVCYFTPIESGTLTAYFFDKNNIDENGNIINTKEIQINMEEVTAALKGTQE